MIAVTDLIIKTLPIEHRAQPARIGRKLRSLRLKRHLTMAQVAEASGLSKGFVSRVEREQTSPSVASLLSLCEVLGVAPGQVLEHSETKVVRSSDAPRVDLGDKDVSEKLLTPPHQRSVQILKSVMKPGGRAGKSMYIMDCDVESVHVLSGSIVLMTTEEEEYLKVGDTATLSGEEPHSWRNDSDEEEAVVLWFLAKINRN